MSYNELMKLNYWIPILILLALRVYGSIPSYKPGDLVKITARINSEPTYYTNAQSIKVLNLRTTLPKYPKLYYADTVTITGTVEGDRLTQSKLINVHHSNNIFTNLRSKLLSVYSKSLPKPHSSLIAGVTIGSKQLIDSNLYDKLKTSGTAHIVVASGMNVMLVAGFLFSLFNSFTHKSRAIIAAIAGIWAYVIISGFDAPIVRAAIMGSITFTALALGRINHAKRALLLTIIVMLLINPNWITDLGFLLSLAATTGLIYFEPYIASKLSFVPNILKQDLSTTISAQIAVAPILYIYFGQFNILSPLINAAILWTIPPLTIIGFIGGAVGLIIPPLARPILLSTYPLTSWFFLITNIFS